MGEFFFGLIVGVLLCAMLFGKSDDAKVQTRDDPLTCTYNGKSYYMVPIADSAASSSDSTKQDQED